MFTGIVRDLGRVVSVETLSTSGRRVEIETSLPLCDLERGASVACNGVCLTVTESGERVARRWFRADVGFQTLACTRFATVAIGDFLNLEPALRLNDALGGHIVTGHVDGFFMVHKNESVEGGFHELVLSLPHTCRNLVVHKGSICVAGTSLTVAELREVPGENAFLVHIMLIPETLERTTLSHLKAGDRVEVEFDQLVKSVASILQNMLPQYTNKP